MIAKPLIDRIVESFVKTYPPSHPRSRARVFYPAFARLSIGIVLAAVVFGGWFLLSTEFPFRELACMFYGMTILPVLGSGAWILSRKMYELSVIVIVLNDRRTGRHKSKA